MDRQAFEALRAKPEPVILAIESSCDETSAAVVAGRTVKSLAISSQIEIHRRFGGVVPEVASRNHTLAVNDVTEQALTEANLGFSDLDAVAVTYGAGLAGALLVGVTYAKTVAMALDIPLIAVDHIKGHVAANYLHSDLTPPFVCLIVSGGHTVLCEVRDYDDFRLLGTTLDDAAGEAFDKVARCLGLPYPGGPEIDRLAREGKPSFALPRMLKQEHDLNFSYSGLKTAVINLLHTAQQRGEEVNKADLCASFQAAALDVLVEKSMQACRRTGLKKLAVAGGVSANSYLREHLRAAAAKAGVRLFIPPALYCTDNAAMIGAEAGCLLAKGQGLADETLTAQPSLRLRFGENT